MQKELIVKLSIHINFVTHNIISYIAVTCIQYYASTSETIKCRSYSVVRFSGPTVYEPISIGFWSL